MIDRLLVLLFVLGVFLPGLALVTGLVPGGELTEKRELAERPELPGDASTLETFPREFEAYYNDHFGFRAFLIRSYNRVFRTWLLSGDSEVLVGKDGWYYVMDAAVEYRNAELFRPWQLEAWRQNLRERRDFLRSRGIEFLFVLVPNKDTIHPEHLPDGYRRDDRTRLDQLVAYLENESDLPVLDLRPALFEAKERYGKIYRRTDTHWNDLGAHAAYVAILQALGERVSLPPPPPLEAYERAQVESNGGDLAALLALNGEISDVWAVLAPIEPRRATEVEAPQMNWSPFVTPGEGLVATEVPDTSLPRAVVFRDSFAVALIPFLSEHFSRALYVWSDHMDGEIIAAERPDVVICEIGERKLLSAPPENSELVGRRGLFFGASRVGLSIDATNAREQLTLIGDVTWAADGVARMEGSKARLELPALEPGAGERVFVRVAYTAPFTTHARLYYGVRGQSDFDRDHSLRREVAPEALEFFFEVPARIWDGRLAFSVGSVAGDYVIEAIEVGRLSQAGAARLERDP